MTMTYTRPMNILLLGLSFYFGSQFTIWLSIHNESPSSYLASKAKEDSLHRSDSDNLEGPSTTRKDTNRNNAAVNSVLRKVDRLLHSQVAVIFEHETLLGTLLGSLIRESNSGLVDLIPSEGYFLDAGMQFGEFGAHMAVNAPERKVMMLDPSPKNVELAKERYGALPNLEILQGGLGDKVGVMKARDATFEMQVGAEFPLYTIDSLFYEKGKKLAFAHLDVEGLELDVLKGAIQTIRQSKPIFTTEVRVYKDVAYTDELMNFIFDLGYDSYVINEVCGYPHMDYRNLLNIPRSMSLELMHSDTFNLLDATKSIFRLPVRKEDQKTIFDLVMPCCALGGECCPGDDINDKSCCSEERVKKWLDGNKPDVNLNYYTWKEPRKSFGRFRYRLRQRHGVQPQ
mmetsp:Transcript_31272/g.62993  ORF Transcript_31272/g.62993 Transcript_31272/m.62993 type:complete len:399 (-) Transcript_31272:162-1358(-)